ncbi:MAG: ABC transporter ATP-binding protein [Bacillota bacterium]
MTKVYTDLFGRARAIGVENLSMSVRPGETLAVLGPNGAGKTTAIKMLAGLLIPTSGQVLVDGLDVTRRRREVLSKIGVMLGDSRSVYWRLTVKDNLEYFAALRGLAGGRARHRISFVTDALALGPLLQKRVGDLSRGMCQRLAFAIALLPDPEALVLDEPTFGLDVRSRREMRGLLHQAASDRCRAVILATHQMDEAEALASMVCILKRGRVVAFDTVSSLLRQTCDGQRGEPGSRLALEDVFLEITSKDQAEEEGSRHSPPERSTGRPHWRRLS